MGPKKECGTGQRNRSTPFGAENLTMQCPLKGGKERDANLKSEVRITKPLLFVCQSLKPVKVKETALSPWPSQPRIPSRNRAISRSHSPSLTVATVKTKIVKTPKKSAKEEQPVVRTSPLTPP